MISPTCPGADSNRNKDAAPYIRCTELTVGALRPFFNKKLLVASGTAHACRHLNPGGNTEANSGISVTPSNKCQMRALAALRGRRTTPIQVLLVLVLVLVKLKCRNDILLRCTCSLYRYYNYLIVPM
jgi:hypothetical protein